MVKTVKLKNFDPTLVGDVDFSAMGAMFNYNNPKWNELANPDDIIITVSDSKISLHIVPSNTEESEQCFFLMSHEAGRELIEWIGASIFDLIDDALCQWVENMVCKLCFDPSDSGGIVLDNINREECSAMYQKYSVMQKKL